jgi:hypothetical protein
MRLQLSPSADLEVIYAADVARYAGSALDPSRHVTLEQFRAYYHGCPSIGFACDGRPIGGMLLDGRQLHMAVLSEFHGRWTWLWRPALEWLFTQVPQAVAAIEADNHRCLELFDRSGWPRQCERDGRVIYLMTPNPKGLRRRAHHAASAIC